MVDGALAALNHFLLCKIKIDWGLVYMLFLKKNVLYLAFYFNILLLDVGEL